MAALRSFVKIQPITGKSGIAQNMDQVRKSINRMGAVTDGIAKSLYDTTELLKFETEYLSDNSKTEVTTIKRKEKKDKTAWTDSMRKLRRTFRKKKRDRLENEAERGVEEGKEEARKAVAKQKPKLTTFGKFLNGLAKVFKYMIIFGALNWLSNPQNAQKAVKVFKLLFTIGKFAFNIAKMGIGLVFDGLTNVIGNFKDENAIKRAFRGILGVMQLMGGLAVLRTAQYMIMPWKLMKDVNRLRMIFQMTNQQSAEADANRKVRKTGYRDKKTGVIYSKEEYEAMKKSAAKADRKSPGAKRAFEDRFGKESRFTKFKGKASAARKRFGAGANKVFGKLGGKLNVGMSVVGGAGRIAAGLAMGEKTSSAVGAGVGQGIGGLLGGVAGTALLGPFLGPFAPIVGNAIGSFLGEWVGKELGPIMEPIFGPIGKAFKMMFEVVKQTIGPLFKQISEPLGMIFSLIGQLGKVLIDAAGVLGSFVKLIFGGLMDVIGGTVQFVVNNAKRLMNPASIAGGIADALTFNLFDFDKENKKAAGGYVGMAAGGALQFGSHPEVLGAVGGILLKSMVGSFGAFGFVGNKVKAVLSPDIRKISSGLGVKVSTGSGATAGGVSNSVSFQPTQKEEKKVENVKNLTYKKNIYNAIHDGLNKLLIGGIKIFDPAAAAQIEQQRGNTSSSASGSSPSSPSGYTGSSGATGSANEKAVLNAIADAEGTTRYANNGYNTQYTGKQFTGDKHPRQILGPSSLRSDAAGRYQFLSTTWDSVMGDPMTPERQDEGALKLIKRRGVDISNGLSISEIYRLGGEWASIEGGPDMVKGGGYGGQAKYSAETFLGMYEKYGGLVERDAGGEVDKNGLPKDRGMLKRLKKARASMKNGMQKMASGGELEKLDFSKGASKGPGTPGGMCVAGVIYTAEANNALLGAPEVAGGIDPNNHPRGLMAWAIKKGYGSVPGTKGKPRNIKGAFGDFGVTSMTESQWGDAVVDGLIPNGALIFNTRHGWDWNGGSSGNDAAISQYGGSMLWSGHEQSSFQYKGKTVGAVYSDVKEIVALTHPQGNTAAHDGLSSGPPQDGSGSGSGSSTTQPAKTGPSRPKTLAEMLAAFETGLKTALTSLKTNVSGGGADTDLAGEPLSTKPSTASSGNGVKIDSSVISTPESLKENVAKKLQRIKDKAVRDEEGDIVPVVMEKLVIQKVTQQINTSGSTTAVYTKPSPLLTQ